MTANRQALGALGGVVSAAAGVAAAEGTAAVLDGTSPVTGVATWVIDRSPYGVVRWAIDSFGSADKVVLVGGILATIGVLAAVAGWVGVRRPAPALGMAATLGAVGLLAAGTARASADALPERLVPSLVAMVVSTLALWAALRALRRSAPVPVVASAGGSEPWPDDERPAADVMAAVADAGGAGEAGPPRRARGYVAADRPTGPEPEWPGGPERPAVVIPGRRPGEDPPGFDRRGFLTAMGAAGIVGVSGGTAWRAFGGSGLDTRAVQIAHPQSRAPRVVDADFGIPKVSPYFTPTKDFYRVDTSIIVPQVRADEWELRIHGMVERPVTLTYADLMRRRLVERDITLACVSNEIGGDLVGNARWVGARIDEILREARPKAGANAVKQTSVDGWTCGTPLSALTDGRDSILAVAMNGEPLTPEHGFPVRMVVPGLYGFVSATKWVVDIEVTRFDLFEAYWTPRGWAEQAPIKTQTRLETPRPYGDQPPGPTTVAGVAWAQGRGISKVEIQVDDGPWQTATLAPWYNKDTWRHWKWEWDAPRDHRTFNLAVRAYDGKGVVQTEKVSPSLPDGVSGYHYALTTVVL